MKKLIKEPLIHFLSIGVLLFLLYGILNNKESKTEIIIDSNLVDEMASKWELKRDRQPNMQELKGMVDEYITQEVLYREALAMNLDHNDEIIKRRLAQKMEFISDGLAESLQPTEEILLTYFEKNKNSYKKPPIYTVQQIYFSTNKRENAFNDAKNALSKEHPEQFGDQLSLKQEYINSNTQQLAIDFGNAFAYALDSLPINKWAGPISSGFGWHIVFINEKETSGFYTFNEVKDRVSINYNFEASQNFKKELITTLLKNYKITFELDNNQLKEELNENL